jgi:Cytidylate kinase-like family
MNAPLEAEHCLSFIQSQLQPPCPMKPVFETAGHKRAVTISRQSGCDAHLIAETLVRLLQSQAPPQAPPWAVFDRNLVEKALADHHLPARLARFMPEDRVRELDDVVDDLLGLHPPSWTLVQLTCETISRLVELGNVIVVGRGANVIAADVPHALHVRLIGSLERRIDRKCQLEHIDRKEAANLVRLEDLGRERYFKKHFNRSINDPSLYHLVINTDCIEPEAVVRLIADLVLRSMPRLRAASC